MIAERMIIEKATGVEVVVSTGNPITQNVVSPAGSLFVDKAGPGVFLSTGASWTPLQAGSVAWTSITGKPTTVAGFGITDFNSLGDARWVLKAGDTMTGLLQLTGGGGVSTAPQLSISASIYPMIDFYSAATFSGQNRNWRIAAVYNNYGKFEILSSTTQGGAPSATQFFIDAVNGYTMIPSGNLHLAGCYLYEDGTYLNVANASGGARAFYIQSTFATTYIYSATIFIGDTSGSNIQLRGNTMYFGASGTGSIYGNDGTSYGALRVGGSKAGWGGFYFDFTATNLMHNSASFGQYSPGYAVWNWRFDGTDTSVLWSLVLVKDVIASGRISVGGSATVDSPGDVRARRTGSPTNGVFYAGDSTGSYLYFNGTIWNIVGGPNVITTADGGVPDNSLTVNIPRLNTNNIITGGVTWYTTSGDLYLRAFGALRLGGGNLNDRLTILSDRVTINGMLLGASSFSSYTADGVWNAAAIPAAIFDTPGGFNRAVRIGYNDGAGGQYTGSIGFAAESGNYVGGLLILQSRVQGTTPQSFNKWQVSHDGQISWGTGAADVDVRLYRSSAVTLTVSGALIATNVLMSTGVNAGLWWLQRDGTTQWAWYANGTTARLYADSYGDIITVNKDGTGGSFIGNWSFSGTLSGFNGIIFNNSVAGSQRVTMGNVAVLDRNTTSGLLTLNNNSGGIVLGNSGGLQQLSGPWSLIGAVTFSSTIALGTGAISGTNDFTLTGSGTFRSSNWFRSVSTTGWYNETYAVGIYANATGQVRTYNGAGFISEAQLTATTFVTATSYLFAGTYAQTTTYMAAGTYVQAGTYFYANVIPGGGLVGVYDPAVYRMIYAMGDAYKIAANGTAITGAYAVVFAYDHPAYINWTGLTYGHGFGLITNGVRRNFIGENGSWFGTPLYVSSTGRFTGAVQVDGAITGLSTISASSSISSPIFNGGVLNGSSLAITGTTATIGGRSVARIRSGSATSVPGDLVDGELYLAY